MEAALQTAEGVAAQVRRPLAVSCVKHVRLACSTALQACAGFKAHASCPTQLLSWAAAPSSVHLAVSSFITSYQNMLSMHLGCLQADGADVGDEVTHIIAASAQLPASAATAFHSAACY